MNIKYYVRTTGERKFSYDLDYKMLVDKEHDPNRSFIKQLKEISGDNAVLLEDDLVLCKNFKEEIEKVINEYPDRIINFFSYPNKYFTTHFTIDFLYNQCTYYPKGLAKIIADKMEEIINNTNQPKLGYDVHQSTAMKSLGISHIIYRPCLVQHLDLKSLIDTTKGGKGLRITPYFKDWLDKHNISMENAFQKENQKILLKEKENFFEQTKN